MKRSLIIGVIAAALAVSPAFAAKGHRAKTTHRPAAKKTLIDWEREAWGNDAPVKTVKKKPTRKVAAKKTVEKSTVSLHPAVKKAPVAAKPVETPKPDAVKPVEKPTVATADAMGAKTAEELEKEAKAAKDPDKKMAGYNQLLQNNPNYPYAGDVYKDMYQLAKRNGADTLTQLQYAGKAAQALQQGRSHGPVSPNDVRNLNKATDDLINQWIEEQTRKLLQEKGR